MLVLSSLPPCHTFYPSWHSSLPFLINCFLLFLCHIFPSLSISGRDSCMHLETIFSQDFHFIPFQMTKNLIPNHHCLLSVKPRGGRWYHCRCQSQGPSVVLTGWSQSPLHDCWGILLPHSTCHYLVTTLPLCSGSMGLGKNGPSLSGKLCCSMPLAPMPHLMI